MKHISMKLGVVLVALCMVFSLSLSADPLGTIVANFDGVLNPVSVSYSINSGGSFTGTQAGFYKFTRTGGTFGQDPLPAGVDIWAFCIELNQTIGGGSTTWDVTELQDGKNPPPALGAIRAGLLQQLFYVSFPPAGFLPGAPAVSNLMAAAIQLAVWEIVHENLANGLNVSAGTTQFTSGNAAVITTANALLSSITASTPKATEMFAMNNNGKQDFVFQIAPIPNVEIPEPSSMAFMGLGLLALGLLRRRVAA